MKIVLSIVFTILLQQSRAAFPKQPPKVTRNIQAVGDPLILTPLIEANKIQEARNQSQVILPAFQNINSYSGYFTVDNSTNSNLFFWFFPSQNDSSKDPVLLWLQGGPGASSLYGLFTENGPFIVDEDLNVTLREYSWTKDHSVLFIDNPVGTGFSFTNGGYAQDQIKVGKDLYAALVQFFKLFPELQKNDFFVTGESYGGKYVPAIGYTIDKNNPTAYLKINLQGIAIGNPLSDPKNQANYGGYLYNLGLIDLATKKYLASQYTLFACAINRSNFTTSTNLLDFIRGKIRNITEIASVYNHQQISPDAPDYWADFLNLDDVRTAIHVGATSFDFESEVVGENLLEDRTKSVASWIAQLLENYRVLLYNGQLDTLDPYPLMVNFIKKLDFSSKDDYRNAPRSIWYVDGEIAGYSKVAGNLTEVLVREAGHMVPSFQPRWAYDLIHNFVRDVPLK